MSKVYIVNAAGRDYDNAKRFGELVELTIGTVNIFDTQRLIVDFKKWFETANMGDWVLLSGSPILNVIAVSVMLSKFGLCNVLIFDVRYAKYVEQVIKWETIQK